MSEALVVKQDPPIHTLARLISKCLLSPTARLQELLHPIMADLHTCLERKSIKAIKDTLRAMSQGYEPRL